MATSLPRIPGTSTKANIARLPAQWQEKGEGGQLVTFFFRQSAVSAISTGVLVVCECNAARRDCFPAVAQRRKRSRRQSRRTAPPRAAHVGHLFDTLHSTCATSRTGALLTPRPQFKSSGPPRSGPAVSDFNPRGGSFVTTRAGSGRRLWIGDANTHASTGTR